MTLHACNRRPMRPRHNTRTHRIQHSQTYRLDHQPRSNRPWRGKTFEKCNLVPLAMQKRRCGQTANACPYNCNPPHLHGPKRQHLCEKVNAKDRNS